jgi:hypothetical protein
MKKAFVEPYFDSDEIEGIQRGLNVLDAQTNSEGILRISYRYPSGSTLPNIPATEANMKDVFFPANGIALEKSTSDGAMVLSSLKDYSLLAQGGAYNIYEYIGTLYVPKDGNYFFGINTTGAAEIYINNEKILSRYSGGAAFSPDETVPPTASTSSKVLKMGEYPFRVRFFQRSATSSSAPEDQKINIVWKTDATGDVYKTIGCDHLYYNPVLMNRTTVPQDSFNENDLVTNLLDYRRFTRYFGVQTASFVSDMKNTTHLGKIKISNKAAPFSPFVCSAGEGSAASSIPTGDLDATKGIINGDINYDGFLSHFQSLGNGNYLSLVREKINDIRKLYNALNDEAFENYKANPSMTNKVDTYQLGTNNLYTQVAIADVLTSDMMAKLNKITPVERFVLRRLLLLIDLVLHAHISMFVFEMVYSSTTSSKLTCESAIIDMVLHFMTRLKALNANYNSMFESKSAIEGQDSPQNEIMNQLYGNIHQFNKNTDTMTKLSKDYRTSKLNLKSNLKKMDAENRVYSTGKKIALTFLILTLIVLVTLVTYAILAQVKPSLKIIGAGMMALFSFVVVLVIYLVKTKKMEGFDTMYNIADLRDKLKTASTIQVIKDAYMMDVIHQISTYIHNTIHTALILQNSKTYNYINHNLQKEINYYSKSKEQVDNSSVLAKSSGRMYSLESRNNLSRVNVYIALIIIFTFAIVGYILSGDSKVLQYIVLAISGFLLFMVALLYILDVERKVRTDGKKYYWGQPNDLLEKL